MKEPLFVNVLFDMQYTEIKYFMTIVHVLKTKQNVINIWIVGKVYTMVFYTIPHLEEQIPQMSNIRTVEKGSGWYHQCHHSMSIEVTLLFSCRVIFFCYRLLFYGLIWTEMTEVLFPVQL